MLKRIFCVAAVSLLSAASSDTLREIADLLSDCTNNWVLELGAPPLLVAEEKLHDDLQKALERDGSRSDCLAASPGLFEVSEKVHRETRVKKNSRCISAAWLSEDLLNTLDLCVQDWIINAIDVVHKLKGEVDVRITLNEALSTFNTCIDLVQRASTIDRSSDEAELVCWEHALLAEVLPFVRSKTLFKKNHDCVQKAVSRLV